LKKEVNILENLKRKINRLIIKNYNNQKKTPTMLKRNLIIVLSTMLIGQAYSQCTQGNYTSPGFFPDTIANMPIAVVTIPYTGTMTAVVPVDTVVSGLTIPVDSIGIANITGLPAGFAWATNTPTNFWHGGTVGCVIISGTPQPAEAGIYSVTFNVEISVLGNLAPSALTGYKIEILGPSYANCFDTLSAASIDTCFSFTPDSAYIYSYTVFGNDSVSVKWLVSSQNNAQQGFVTAVYPVNSNACFVSGLTIQCNKSATYKFYDRLYIEDLITNIKPMNENDNAIDVFPNPATDNMTIKYPAKSEITILNIEGQLIKSLKLTNGKTDLDVSAFSSGVYIIRAMTDKGIMMKKFVKE